MPSPSYSRALSGGISNTDVGAMQKRREVFRGKIPSTVLFACSPSHDQHTVVAGRRTAFKLSYLKFQVGSKRARQTTVSD